MSKIAILLFAVLVASVVDASGTKDELKSLQNRLESYFATEIDKIEEKYNATKIIIKKKSGIIYTDENTIYETISNNVAAILSKAQDEIRELRNQIQSIRGTQACDDVVNYLKSKADAFLTSMYRCTDPILTKAVELISKMETKYELLHSSLILSRNRIAGCHHTVDTTEKVATAISCIEAIENDTKSFIAEYVPAVLAKIDETHNYLSTFKIDLDNCGSGYAAFQMETVDVINRAKTCYQQEITNEVVLRVVHKIEKLS